MKVVVTDAFGADKSRGQVGVNLARPFDSRFTFSQIPGPAFVLADREENDLVHAVINAANDLIAG